MMDAITFRFLISLAVSKGLDMRLMDVITAYLYGSIDIDNNPICPCIFIKKSKTAFAIIVVYVDNLNLIGTPEELTIMTNYLIMQTRDERSSKNKILSWAIDRALPYWHFGSPISL